MKKSYKMRWILLVLMIVPLFIGCQKNSLENDTKEFVKNNSYSAIYSDLNSIINEIKMFPTKEKEEKFIYYVKSIKDYHEKFTNDELINFNNLLDFSYNFSFNKMGYTISDFNNDKYTINSYIK